MASETLQKRTVGTTSWPRGLITWLTALGIGIIALVPRCLGLAEFTTIDESYHWPGRVERFAQALSSGKWAATDQTGHPGVTTMWLGTLGRWLAAAWGVHDPGWAGGGLEYLAMLRLPLAVANSLAVVAGYLLLHRLLRPRVALLAGLLWACSPFIVAHSRLLHLDGLLTSFMTLSLLSLLQIIGERTKNKEQNVHRKWLIASGVFAGLALLTKGPALILLPVAGLLLFGLQIADCRLQIAQGHSRFRLPSFVVRLVGRYLVWLGVAALVFALLWPAMWVAPRAAVTDVIHEVLSNGGEPEPAGNYFLGQPVADPGPLFYPAVLLLRTTPLTLLGVLALPFVLWRRRTKDERRRNDPHSDHLVTLSPCQRAKTERRLLFSLLFFALFFTIAMSAGPKKFDRYLLPIWPSLEILAAAGLFRVADWLGKRRTTNNEQRTLRSLLVLCSVCFVLSVNLVWYYPYYLGYFNPLFGGGKTGQYVMLTGWGEGMEQVGAWLRERPDLHSGPVLSWIAPTLAPFVPKEVRVLDLRTQYLHTRTSYVVLYSRSVQRKENAEAEAYVRQFAPLYTFSAHGIDYAEVFQIPRPFTEPVGATFGDGLLLRGFSSARLGSTLVITPSWSIESDQPGGRFAFVHIINEQGQKVAQVDAPLDQGMFARWQNGQQFDNPFPLPLPAKLPPGRYRVVMGVYDPATGARLDLHGGTPLPESVDGPQVVLLTTITVT
ncbi:MAG TPA: phospholipid carrier-dependent glycosyltransferase [Roseiflexaceae bacterium]|nr:phospholipid carrier-dependent glycosyltransferase [Roseiflexaceae bacterium]